MESLRTEVECFGLVVVADLGDRLGGDVAGTGGEQLGHCQSFDQCLILFSLLQLLNLLTWHHFLHFLQATETLFHVTFSLQTGQE